MKTLHVISHTHWDREWYLTFQQFRLKLVHLIDGLLDILEEDPDFKHFMLDGQTIVLEDYLQMRPEMQDVLREHIQDGRILIGPWHILPDMFLVSPEAHIRNLLQGARTSRKFGPKMSVGYIPDPFGHPGQVPQILKGFGIEVAALWRGVSDMPTEIWWESPDGSRVLMAYLRDSYSNGAGLPVRDFDQFTSRLSLAGDSLAEHSAVDDYLIMFGTDHMEPSPRTSAAIAHANESLPDTRVIHSTLPTYVQRITDQLSKLGSTLPAIRGELRSCDRSHLLPGVLSTRMWIKQRNHHSQTLLETWAEPFSVFAEHIIGDDASQDDADTAGHEDLKARKLRNPAPILRQAWRLLMENHPHDSICGCSIDQVHDEMRPRFDQADQIGEEVTLQALQALANAVDTRSDEAISAIVLFNPFGVPHQDLVEIELNLPESIETFELVDAEGGVIAHEFTRGSNVEYANLMMRKENLRDSIGYVHDGRVLGAAITDVRVSQDGSVVKIVAVLDDAGQPNIPAWRQAEEDIARYEADSGVTHVHVIARTPQVSIVRFLSPQIPAMGWSTLWVRRVEGSKTPAAAEVSPLLRPLLPIAMRFAQSAFGARLLARLQRGDEEKPPFVIENDDFHVEASKTDGTLTITDKRTGTVFRGLNRFVDGGDAGDEYNYSPPAEDTYCMPRLVSIKAYRRGLVPSLEIEYALKIPVKLSADRQRRSEKAVSMPIITRISLIPNVARIDIHTEIENLAHDHRLRVHFPAPFDVQGADHDGHCEVVRRPVGVPQKGDDWVEEPRPEVPQRAFTDVSDGLHGLMIANRGLPEVEVIRTESGSEIALTLLRCVGWLSRDDLPVRDGHAGPGFETPGAQVPGTWAFDYAIIPHRGGWSDAYQHAFASQTALRAIDTGLHGGEISGGGSFLAHSPAAFVISAVKEAEDGKGWILRGYNISSAEIQLNLKPLQRFSKATRVNLAEEAIAPLQEKDDGSVSLTVAGHEIVSVRFLDSLEDPNVNA